MSSSNTNTCLHSAILPNTAAMAFRASPGTRWRIETRTLYIPPLDGVAKHATGSRTAVTRPVACFATPSSGGMYNVRVSIRQRVPGEARNAIAAVFGSMAECKQVFVFDDDIDVFSDEQCDWALATRYQGDRDTIQASGFRVVPLDPSLAGARTGAKIGFDCTIPFGKRQSLEWGIPTAPVMPKANGHGKQSVADTLAAGPA